MRPRPSTAADADLAPDEALHRIRELRGDQSFMQRYMSGDKLAAARFSALHDQA